MYTMPLYFIPYYSKVKIYFSFITCRMNWWNLEPARVNIVCAVRADFHFITWAIRHIICGAFLKERWQEKWYGPKSQTNMLSIKIFHCALAVEVTYSCFQCCLWCSPEWSCLAACGCKGALHLMPCLHPSSSPFTHNKHWVCALISLLECVLFHALFFMT